MAKQKGLINFDGKIGNFAFYKTREGYSARDANGGITAERIRVDPKFQRTRENGQEFGRAGRASKLLRDNLKTILAGMTDSRVGSRLTTEFMKVVQSDPLNGRGDRTALAGNPELLVGFEFNGKSALGQVLSFPVSASIDRASGAGQIELPAFVPGNMINAPDGASHYHFRLGIISANFDAETTVQAMMTTPPQQLLMDEVPGNVLPINLPPGFEDGHIFLVFGVQFLQIVNGREYPLNNRLNSVMTIIDADAVEIPVVV
jgi:hypothetical protein